MRRAVLAAMVVSVAWWGRAGGAEADGWLGQGGATRLTEPGRWVITLESGRAYTWEWQADQTLCLVADERGPLACDGEGHYMISIDGLVCVGFRSAAQQEDRASCFRIRPDGAEGYEAWTLDRQRIFRFTVAPP